MKKLHRPRLLIILGLVTLLFAPVATFAQDEPTFTDEQIEETQLELDEQLLEEPLEEPLIEEGDSSPTEEATPSETDIATEIVRGRVVEIINHTTAESDEGLGQKLKVRLQDGSQKGQTVEVQHGGQSYLIKERQLVKNGETVVILIQPGDENAPYVLVDRYRLPQLIGLAVVFLAIVFAIGRRRGLTSLLGLVISIAVLVVWILPWLAAGHSPLIIAGTAGLVILTVSLLIAHGFNRRSMTALVSAVVTFGLAIGLSLAAVMLTKLSGFGSEDAAGLQFSSLAGLDFRGLLLAGILIGTLGVLDDVTVSQTVTIAELAHANPELTARELLVRGLRVGREHIASLVNTLALAYAGTSLPMLLFFATANDQPFWLTVNSEFITEEVVRTIIGSMTLILAVPIATLLAARVFGKKATSSPAPSHP